MVVVVEDHVVHRAMQKEGAAGKFEAAYPPNGGSSLGLAGDGRKSSHEGLDLAPKADPTDALVVHLPLELDTAGGGHLVALGHLLDLANLLTGRYYGGAANAL